MSDVGFGASGEWVMGTIAFEGKAPFSLPVAQGAEQLNEMES
jgi:hypothetical protein